MEDTAEPSVHCIDVTGSLIIDYTMREYCTLPYPGHPEGCPHFGKRKECPPHAPLIEHFMDLSKPHYFLLIKGIHAPERSTEREEGVTWELSAESMLCTHVKKFQESYPGTVFTLHPSAVGVDVFKTAKNIGIPLESHPEKTFHKIALIGYPLQPNE